MVHFTTLLRRFAKDESGVFAVIFGVMAIVLIALGGAVVDYVSIVQTRARAQVALDAAALALQPELFKPGYNINDLKAKAQAIMLERIGDTRVTASIDRAVGNIPDGTLYFHASVSMPTTFVSLVGVPTLSGDVESEATRKKLALEVVMVLDNSGSMASESRMTNLVNAAKCATYILMYDKVVDAPNNSNTCVPASGAKLVDDVKVSIVPFTMFVNVGANNANASWIDKTGASVIHYDNFDNDDDEDRLLISSTSPAYQFPTRQTLFAATKEAWRGCVEARPHIKSGSSASSYLDTDDTAPTGLNTLFVPMFSPDSNSGNNYIGNDSPAVCDRPAYGATRCDITETRTRRNTSSSWTTTISGTPNSSSPTNFFSSMLYPNAYYGRLPSSCSCRSTTYNQDWTGSNTSQTRTGYCASFTPTNLTDREYQERVCKYYGGIDVSNFSNGPNGQCTRTPILPLTSNPTDVINTINAMQAEGGTNIHEGTAWGFRVLSPGEPFTEAGPYDEATSKVMIVMTDGENTAYKDSGINGSSYYSAYGFPYNSTNSKDTSTSGGNIERLGKLSAPSDTGAAGVSNASLVADMNQRTLDTCTNAKAAGITMYTIGLATDKVTQSTPAVVQTLLKNCASAASNARFPAQSSELKETFESIANDLTALRLAM